MIKNLGQVIYTFAITSIFLTFWILFFLIPNKLIISSIFLLGIAIMIIAFIIFINLNHDKGNQLILKFRGPSENLIKIILLLLLLLALFFEPVYGPKSVVLWSSIRPLNYFKAINSLISCAFLPGGNIYKIFFPDNTLSKRFKIEPFFLKITIYPLLSFIFFGVTVLIMDQFEFSGELIMKSLIVMIFGLSFLDFIIQKIRSRFLISELKIIKLSKYTFIIVIFALGILLFSLGIQINTLYLIRGDSWVGVMPANYVGRDNMNAIEDRTMSRHYPMFWGYIIYALSMLSGMPYINANVMLAPFCYLYINIIYLLMKAILFEIKEKYAVLSTILMSISSGIPFLYSDFHGEVGTLGLMALCQFYFIYKTFGFLLLFLSIAIFIIITKPNERGITKYGELIFSEENKYLILIAIFLIISFITYMIPLLMGICFIYVYCIFSEYNKKIYNIKLYSILTFYLAFFFILFDLLMFYYLSWISYAQVQIFLQIMPHLEKSEFQSIYYITYLFLIGIFITSIFFQHFLNLIFKKYNLKKENKDKNTDKKLDKKMVFFLIIYSIFLIIEIIGKFYEIFFGIDALNRSYYLFHYLDKIFLYIGFIGIIGIYLSYYSFKKNNALFFLLASWVIFSFSIAFLLITKNFLRFYPELPKEIPDYESFMMIIWYERFWFYSIPPLCIFASIGILKLIKTFQDKILIQKKKYYKTSIKYFTLSMFIFLTFSGLTIAGMWYGSDKHRQKRSDILVIGWASENLPRNSKILIEKTYDIERGLKTMTYCRIYYINTELEEDVNETVNIERIRDLKKAKIKYLLISKDYLEKSSSLASFIKNYLIPYFYNQSEYENSDYIVYYAPYFD